MAWPQAEGNDWDVALEEFGSSELGFFNRSATTHPPDDLTTMNVPFYSNQNQERLRRTTPMTRPSPSPPPPTRNPPNLPPHHSTEHQQQPTMTYSASCPSFTDMYGVSSEDLMRDIQEGTPSNPRDGLMSHSNGSLQHLQLQEPLHDFSPLHSSIPNHLPFEKNYDYLLQYQQEHQHSMMRQYPHQQVHFQSDHTALLSQSRRQLQGSASFTSLSSMETEYRRQSASKRKKGGERWLKLQRHKSFDSTGTSAVTTPTSTTSMDLPSFTTTTNGQFESNGDAPFIEAPDSEIMDFSLDDLPNAFASDGAWPLPLNLAGGIPFEAYNASQDSADLLEEITNGSLQPLQKQQETATLLNEGKNLTNLNNAAQSQLEIDLLLSERANMSSLFDAIRDFEAPNDTTSELSPPQEELITIEELTVSAKKKKEALNPCRSPPLHPQRPLIRASSDSKASLSATINGANHPDQIPMRMRLQQILTRANGGNSTQSPSTELSPVEQEYIDKSPLFAPGKAPETAGSLWLLLHVAGCKNAGCSISGCNVMSRVLRHCMGCELVVGSCKTPCNEAKAMLFHYGFCRSQGRSQSTNCTVCWNLKEIDQAHNALSSNSPPPVVPSRSPPAFLPRSMSHPAGLSSIAIAPQPSAYLSPQFRPSSVGSNGTSSSSKHVPIQPNPLPTASNPMGLIRSFPHFGYSLSLYLEQTSMPFRAEVKARVEKRVTAAAGQDLIQHMHKKTRLRSLDDLRSEARTIVLGELERELHFHMQAYSWATANSKNNNTNAMDSTVGSPASGSLSSPESGSPLPPYLLSAAAAGFAAFYAQQATLQAAMTGMTPMNGKPSRLSSSLPTNSGDSFMLSSSPLYTASFASKRKLSTPTESSVLPSPKVVQKTTSDPTKEPPDLTL